MKWVLGTLALLGLGLALELNLLVYAMYVLLGVLLLSRFLTYAWTDPLEVERQCDCAEVEIGDSAHVDVGIRNPTRLPIPWLILEESLPRDALVQMPVRLEAKGRRLALTRLEAGGRENLHYEVTFRMRGYYQLGPLLVETGDLFGLHRRFRVMTDPHFVLVRPKVFPLEGYNLASRRPMGEIRLAHRLFEDPTRIAAIRNYQPGDPLNRIHWPATARTGQLHSRVYEASCVAGATFLLDFHESSYTGPGTVAAAELAVSVVASLAHAVYLLGQQIGFISNGRDAADRIREEGWRAEFTTRTDAYRRAGEVPRSERLQPVVVRTRKGAEPFDMLLRALARLEPTDGLTFPELVGETVAEMPRDATVVAVVREVTPPVAIALGDLGRQGYAVTAVVVTWGSAAAPDWARPPDWAGQLLDEGVDFRQVSDEATLMSLCAEAIVR